MNLLWIAILSSIPAGISMLLFLLRNRLLPRQVENRDADATEAYYDSPTEKNVPPFERRIPPQDRSGGVPASSQPDRPLSVKQLNANRKVVQNFISGDAVEAIEIVRKSLDKGDFRWRTLLDALEAEAQNYSSAGFSLTLEIYNKWLPKKDATNIETASQCLVFGTWYANIIKKPDEKIVPTLVDTWYLMGKTYTNLPKLLNRPEADFLSDAQKCFSKAHDTHSSLKHEKGEAEIRNL